MLPKGADILIQVHYHKTGKPETDTTAVGLYLSNKPLPREVHTGFVFPNLTINQAIAARPRSGRPEGRANELESSSCSAKSMPSSFPPGRLAMKSKHRPGPEPV